MFGGKTDVWKSVVSEMGSSEECGVRLGWVDISLRSWEGPQWESVFDKFMEAGGFGPQHPASHGVLMIILNCCNEVLCLSWLNWVDEVM